MPELTRPSPAKINLTLRVCGRRPDGFHEIESLVARIGLCDTLTVSPRADGRATVICDDARIPCDDSNLALRAWRALADATGVQQGVDIAIAKRIPAGSGLGGGSSNAATVLVLLNGLWRLDLTNDALAEIGAKIGSDVPLFFHSPLCVIRGRGEQIEDLDQALNVWVTLILPDIHCDTPRVYAAWDRLAEHPPRPAIDDILANATSARALMPGLFNDLEGPAFDASPALANFRDAVHRLSDAPVRMTGSGAGLFRLFDDQAEAHAFAVDIRAQTESRVEVAPLATQ